MSLPRSRENNRGTPSLYEYNLLVQKVNALEKKISELAKLEGTSSVLPSHSSSDEGKILTVGNVGITSVANTNVLSWQYPFLYNASFSSWFIGTTAYIQTGNVLSSFGSFPSTNTNFSVTSFEFAWVKTSKSDGTCLTEHGSTFLGDDASYWRFLLAQFYPMGKTLEHFVYHIGDIRI